GGIGHQAAQPGAEWCLAPEASRRARQPQEDVLHHVGGVFRIGQDAQRQTVGRACVAVIGRRQGRRIALTQGGELPGIEIMAKTLLVGFFLHASLRTAGTGGPSQAGCRPLGCRHCRTIARLRLAPRLATVTASRTTPRLPSGADARPAPTAHRRPHLQEARMKHLLAGTLAILATPALAQAHDCAALADSPFAMPRDYPLHCVAPAPAKRVLPGPFTAHVDGDVPQAYAVQLSAMPEFVDQG